MARRGKAQNPLFATTAKRTRLHSPSRVLGDCSLPACILEGLFDGPDVLSYSPRDLLSSPLPKTPNSPSLHAAYRRVITNSPLRHRFRPDVDQEHKFPGVPTTDELMEYARSIEEFYTTSDESEDFEIIMATAPAGANTEEDSSPPSHSDTPNFYNQVQSSSNFSEGLSFVVPPDTSTPTSPDHRSSHRHFTLTAFEKGPSTAGITFIPVPVLVPVEECVIMDNGGRGENSPINVDKIVAPNTLKVSRSADTEISNAGRQNDIKKDFSKLTITIPDAETPENPHIPESKSKDKKTQDAYVPAAASSAKPEPKTRNHASAVTTAARPVPKASNHAPAATTVARPAPKTSNHAPEVTTAARPAPKRRKWETARDKPVVQSKCSCKKTECLKLYCECFANQQFCQDCHCMLCKNTAEHVTKRRYAVRRLTHRNPVAFVPKTSKNRGCRCQRSKCQKGYCECFQAGKSCGINCRCLNCLNGRHDKHRVHDTTRNGSLAAYPYHSLVARAFGRSSATDRVKSQTLYSLGV